MEGGEDDQQVENNKSKDAVIVADNIKEENK